MNTFRYMISSYNMSTSWSHRGGLFPPRIKAYSVQQSKRSVCLLRVCEAERKQLGRGCWEGHLSGRELTHLFSVWSTVQSQPGHTAQCYRCRSGEQSSAYLLLALIAAIHANQELSLLFSQFLPSSSTGPGARLLQFLDRPEPAGTWRELKSKQTSQDVNSSHMALFVCAEERKG